jgi:hypothetical protein
MTDTAGIFAASAIALYAAHHVGDYWVQTDHQAAHKGQEGHAGRRACLGHVVTYVATQSAFLAVTAIVLGLRWGFWPSTVALLISGVTHYLADRREFGIMFRLARLIPGKDCFLKLGVPRPARTVEVWGPCPSCEGRGTSYDESTGGKCWDCRAGGMLPGSVEITDNPSLGTGGWALDQAWHIALGVFVPALVIAGMA